MASLPKPLIVIPARMASSRLPGKPLADIHGIPLVVHVWRRAMEADIGRVIVAAAESEVAEAVRAAGGEAILTDPAHASGSDRVHEAAGLADPDGAFGAVINLQGDQPNIDGRSVGRALSPLADPEVAIGTIAAPLTDPGERDNPNVVKAAVSLTPGARIGRALYFSRAPVPHGDGPLFHHIGVYAFRRAALDRFVRLQPSPLERRERLEQLRALENGMRIDVARVDTIPISVDTPADLEQARRLLRAAS